MLVLGHGGTGKSKLINAITETFQYYEKQNILAKCGTTGIAATNIGGQTIHSWAGLPNSRPKGDDWLRKGKLETRNRRKRNIEGKKLLILDEISMQDKAVTYDLSQAIGYIKGQEEGAENAFKPFGGMHIIACGDFHQFPPVRNQPGALYVHRPTKDGKKALLGRELFLQFDTVVILDEQMRVIDPRWQEILDRLRVGECNEDDIEEVKKLVLGGSDQTKTDFSKSPWGDAILVTPRHAVRELWNEYSVKKHCRKTGHRQYIIPADDFEAKTGNELSMKVKLAVASMTEKQTDNLHDSIEIAVGMKMMITANIAVEAGIANGTRGRIHGITLDERDTNPTTNNGVVTLKYPPAVILFKPERPTLLRFEGVQQGLIPITPSTAKFDVTIGKSTSRIARKQYAIAPGYAFTDYKSQGQTIEYVIIDLGAPPVGPLTGFGTYVALSRSRGRETIRILRGFNETLFQNHPSEDLRKEMVRLERLNKETEEKWDIRKTS